MDIRVFEKSGATILADVVEKVRHTDGRTEFWLVRNPRAVSAYEAQDPNTGKRVLQVDLVNLVRPEFLKDPKEGYTIKYYNGDYQEVTDQFNDHLIEMYDGYEKSKKFAEEANNENNSEEDEKVVSIFEK